MASPDETTTIVISADVAILIDRAVATGSYVSASDAIRDALMEREARGEDLLGLTPDEACRLWDEGIASGPGRGLGLEEIEREALRRAGRRAD